MKKLIMTIDRLLDHRGCGVVYLDPQLKIIKLNQTANKHFKTKSFLSVSGGKLISWDKEDNRKLLESLSVSIRKNQIGTIFLQKYDSNKPCRVDIYPFCDSVEIDGQHVALMLEIDRFGGTANLLSAAIKAYYGLTASELALLESLHQGSTLKGYASSRKIKISTVRWTLGNIFSKTGTRSQKDLQSLVRLFSI